MRARIGVDADSGLLHAVTTTAANESDVEQIADLLHGEEERSAAILKSTAWRRRAIAQARECIWTASSSGSEPGRHHASHSVSHAGWSARVVLTRRVLLRTRTESAPGRSATAVVS
jgi:IS5 family transposase